MSTEDEKPKKRKPGKLSKTNNKLRRHIGKKCGFLNADGTQCRANVCFTDGRGVHYCAPHKSKYFQQGYGEMMDGLVINNEIDKLAKQKGIKIPEISVIKQEAIQKVENAEKLAEIKPDSPEGAAAVRMRFGVDCIKHTADSNRVELLDLEYYTPDYNPDLYFQLELSIRRQNAKVNMLFRMLHEIEMNEQNVKTTVLEGEMPVGTRMGVEQGKLYQKTTKHLDFYTLRLKLHEQLEKAESNLAKLLKQKSDLLVTALEVIKREGLMFSREAGMVVLKAAQREDDKPMEEYHERIKMETTGEYDVVEATTEFIKDDMDSEW